MENLYIKILIELGVKDDSMVLYEDEIYILRTSDKLALDEPDTFIEKVLERYDDKLSGKRLIFNLGELYQIIPSDPVVDNIEEMENIRERFEYVESTYLKY